MSDGKSATVAADAEAPRQEYDVLKMLSWAFIVQIISYAGLCIGSLISVPQEGAWTIVTDGQKGLMQLMGINLGALAGVAQQRRAGGK